MSIQAIEFVRPPDVQGRREEISYTVDTTDYGGVPSAITIIVYDESAGSLNVTTTVMPTGSVSIAGTIMTWPKLKNLTVHHLYRVECVFTCGGNVWEANLRIKGVL